MSMMRINCGLTKPPGPHDRVCGLKIAARWRKSGRHTQFIGCLDIGYDIRGLPNSLGFNRLQAYRPSSTRTCAGYADDVELNVPAHWMPLQGIGDAPPDLVERSRRFSRKPLEIHRAPLCHSRPAATAPAIVNAMRESWSEMVNGGLRPRDTRRECAPRVARPPGHRRRRRPNVPRSRCRRIQLVQLQVQSVSENDAISWQIAPQEQQRRSAVTRVDARGRPARYRFSTTRLCTTRPK
jgi:hypothetical protein